MFRTILYLIALIVGLYWVFRKRKPEPFEPKIIDRTLDPNSPKTILFLRMAPSDPSENSEDDSL